MDLKSNIATKARRQKVTQSYVFVLPRIHELESIKNFICVFVANFFVLLRVLATSWQKIFYNSVVQKK